jgi:hypothetical protein
MSQVMVKYNHTNGRGNDMQVCTETKKGSTNKTGQLGTYSNRTCNRKIIWLNWREVNVINWSKLFH